MSVIIIILAVTVALLTVFTIGGISIFGSIGIFLFSDVFVCIGALIALIVYLVKKKKNKNN